MDLTQIRHLVSTERAEVDKLIIDSLHSDVPLIELIGHHIINSGGKRLRPLIVLLSALACGYQGKQHIALAAIIEFIHTATLLHDDVVDESMLRRGNETANAVWGDHSSVLVGDFLYSRAFQMMVRVNNMAVMQLLADTTNKISEGEVLQLLNAKDPDTTEARYFAVIQCKTAILFAAGAKLGALISDVTTDTQEALYHYGMNLGIAYQLVDDLLDYQGDVATMGKNVGDDLAEGKPTLPLLYVMQHGDATQRALVQDAITHARTDKLAEIQQAIQQTGALDYTRQQAQHYANLAMADLKVLSDNPHKQALIGLCQFIIERTA
jgi:octaprenyl-diphosphate synthase